MRLACLRAHYVATVGSRGCIDRLVTCESFVNVQRRTSISTLEAAFPVASSSSVAAACLAAPSFEAACPPVASSSSVGPLLIDFALSLRAAWTRPRDGGGSLLTVNG